MMKFFVGQYVCVFMTFTSYRTRKHGRANYNAAQKKLPGGESTWKNLQTAASDTEWGCATPQLKVLLAMRLTWYGLLT
jgi:hypothetical protein